ncbi:MAG: FecR family protein [Alphaproteobacteria bacterium]
MISGQGSDPKVIGAQYQRNDTDGIAAAWAARLGGDPLSDTERRELANWLDESPSHGAAFDEARRIWDRLSALRRAPGALAKDIPPLRRPPARVPAFRTGTGGTRRRGWFQVTAVAACLLLLIGGTGFWQGNPALSLFADYRTGPGEHRSIDLSDGSAVELGPDSAFAVSFTADERRIKLLSGQAYFLAAPMAPATSGGETRPFIVEAAGGTTRALGTRFVVDRLSGDTVEVTVAEHDVDVAISTETGDVKHIVVSPGQSVRYGHSGLGPIRTGNPDQVTAWRRNRIIFDHRSLGDVVTALNRYRRGLIVITDSALAARQVSGVFETGDPDTTLATIIRNLNIRAVSVPPFVTLLY